MPLQLLINFLSILCIKNDTVAVIFVGAACLKLRASHNSPLYPPRAFALRPLLVAGQAMPCPALSTVDALPALLLGAKEGLQCIAILQGLPPPALSCIKLLTRSHRDCCCPDGRQGLRYGVCSSLCSSFVITDAV